MLDETYLVKGLNALSRAHERDFFGDGHRGAAVIAAYYLAHEQNLAPSAHAVIAECLGNDLENNDLFGPVPEQDGKQELIGQIADALVPRIGVFKMVGHDVIFASAAIKALRQLPEAITPWRIQGICALIKRFDSAESEDPVSVVGAPLFSHQKALVEFVLCEFLDSLARFRGFGQGWAGHLLTFSQALVELYDMGYEDLANAGHPALETLISILRRGPSREDRRIPDHPPNPLSPLESEYWQQKRPGLSGLGHAFKYPYSYYNLLARVDDPVLRKQCDSRSYQIF